MVNYKITPKIIEQLKQSGLCDDKGIAFATNMNVARVNPLAGQAPYQGNNWYVQPGKQDTMMFDSILAVNGNLLCCVNCKAGMFGVSISPEQIAKAYKMDKQQWIRNICWSKSGNAVCIILKSDEGIIAKVDSDKTQRETAIELAKAFGFNI